MFRGYIYPIFHNLSRNRGRDLPTIYTYGSRNPQGMAVHPLTDQVWITEHGPMGGDELNLLVPGKNYGWPVVPMGPSTLCLTNRVKSCGLHLQDKQ